MNKPADYSYPAIVADLKAKHPGEDYNRLAAAASYLYQSRLAAVDRFGGVEYHVDARPIAPRCFPAPKLGTVDAETMARFLDGRVLTPDEVPRTPEPRGPRAVPREITEAEALERRYAEVLDAMSEGATMFDRRENAQRIARELAAAARGDGSAAVERAASLGANGHDFRMSR